MGTNVMVSAYMAEWIHDYVCSSSTKLSTVHVLSYGPLKYEH